MPVQKRLQFFKAERAARGNRLSSVTCPEQDAGGFSQHFQDYSVNENVDTC